MADWNSRANSLFARLAEVADPAERQRFLDAECGGDAALRAEVEALLDAHVRADGFLAVPPGAEVTAALPAGAAVTSAPEAGTLIAGRYKLLQPIGEGGMGTVWMADQTEPVRRRVAVKLVRADRGDSKTILARFEADRQAIALMDHPHVAKLLDAGTTEAGRPFFVMELVKGVPLAEYCDSHRLPVPERLELFMQVCGAVQHAHQKGIIHRDLKPSNILVESHDGKPVPKVIDFGLAKAAGGLQLTENTLFTGFGHVLGTPLYMAPEQATFNALDIDTRADIYALGVILYELLTGSTPITREAARVAAFDEVLRLVREQDAPTPSSRWKSGESSAESAANRQGEPAKLGRFVKGELDWIVMKALAKERERRYETAGGFARDVERFLNHEPVQAGPPGAGYRLRKLVRRNRGAAAAVGAVMLALVLGIAGTTWGLIRAERAREAETLRADGERAANIQSGKRLEQIGQLNEVMRTAFRGLDPRSIEAKGKSAESILADQFDEAATKLMNLDIEDREALGEIQLAMGEALHGGGKYDRAEVLLRQAREGFQGLRHLDATEALAALLADNGKGAEAIRLLEWATEARRAQSGARSPEYAQAEMKLARAYALSANPEAAVPILDRRVQAEIPGTEGRLIATAELGHALRRSKRPGDALRVLEPCHPDHRRIFGPQHPYTLEVLYNIGKCQSDLSLYALAASSLSQAVDSRMHVFSVDHPVMLEKLVELRVAYLMTGDIKTAGQFTEMLHPLFRRALGDMHAETIKSVQLLSAYYGQIGRLEYAVPLIQDQLQAFAQARRVEDAASLDLREYLGVCFYVMRRSKEGVAAFSEALRIRTSQKIGDEAKLANTRYNLAECHAQALDFAAAVPHMEAVYRGGHSESLQDCGTQLAEFYLRSGRRSDALKLAVKLIRTNAERGSTQKQTGRAFESLAEAMLDYESPTQAEALLRESVRIGIHVEPDTWELADTTSKLGQALLQQHKHDEAGELLVRSHAFLTDRRRVIPAEHSFVIAKSLHRLVMLAEAKGQKATADSRRWELASHTLVPWLPPARELLPAPAAK